MPDEAQKLIESAQTRADFYYSGDMVAVYIDGPEHDLSDIRAKDLEIEEQLLDEGIHSIRFVYRSSTWLPILKRWQTVFGTAKPEQSPETV